MALVQQINMKALLARQQQAINAQVATKATEVQQAVNSKVQTETDAIDSVLGGLTTVDGQLDNNVTAINQNVDYRATEIKAEVSKVSAAIGSKTVADLQQVLLNNYYLKLNSVRQPTYSSGTASLGDSYRNIAGYYGASINNTSATRKTLCDVSGGGEFFGACANRLNNNGGTSTLWITINGTEYVFTTDVNSMALLVHLDINQFVPLNSNKGIDLGSPRAAGGIPFETLKVEVEVTDIYSAAGYRTAFAHYVLKNNNQIRI